jgi:F-type H+-transporting ATPase subunit epsilon
MAEDKVQFELVSPEKLIFSEPVDMVVVPGAEGDFGVLPRHSLLISTVRTGVIRVYQGNDVTEQIFVAGGFCEVTDERCTVLAEEAVRIQDIDRSAIEALLTTLREDAQDAKSDGERASAEAKIAVQEAKLDLAA